MAIHQIVKQQLLAEPFSEDALRLARAIYNTYIEDDKNLFMEINLKTVSSLLKIPYNIKAVQYIIKLLEELNEPLLVKNFKYFAKTSEMKFLQFCKYKINKETIEIELSEEFLLAESEYMLDKFLT